MSDSDLPAQMAAFADALGRAAVRHGLGERISGLTRLSGGASQETWAFDAHTAAGPAAMILRRTPGGREPTGSGLPLGTEAAVIREARAHGVAAPDVLCVLDDADGLGPAYVMTRIEGETIARKILRDDAFAAARPVMAGQCGTILARLHRIPTDALADLLPVSGARAQWTQYRDIYDAFGEPRPVFEYAFRWLEERLPGRDRTALVHGDFRNGNLMVGPEGVRAVLDWELAHLGDPMEDLGWICVNSWRFGQSHHPVGGFGRIEDMAAGYEAAGGGPVDLDRVAFWQVFGTLKWGVMCLMMVSAFRSGADPSVERAAIGRRASETEIDLINLLAAPGGVH